MVASADVRPRLAALRNGMKVVLMTEETDWVGGQLTSQAVPPDEHPWIESFGWDPAIPDLSAARSRILRIETIPLTEAARSREC